MRASVLAGLFTALALPCAAQETGPRYAIDLSIVEGGVEIASARTVITEGGQAQGSLIGADGEYAFDATLVLEQGDGGDERLVLEAYLGHDGADIATPRLSFRRGGTALIRIGDAGPDGATLTNGVELEVTALPET